MKDLKKYKRIVIKIGSALIADYDNNKINDQWLSNLASDVLALKNDGHDVVIVSSGSIATGCIYLSIDRKTLNIEDKQAVASFGQTYLMKHYQDNFAKHNLKVSQILLTIEDSDNRKRYLNSKNTIDRLLSFGIIPIINENDTVATDEIRFSDNDRLAARVTQITSSDLLILLSDIDGLYDSNPKLNPNANLIKEIKKITPKIEKMAGGSTSAVGTGGMISKLVAGKLAMKSGSDMIIALGNVNKPISNFLKTGKFSIFRSNISPLNARKKWLSNLSIKGYIYVDDGAKNALQNGKSLLASGIIKIEGRFSSGDLVSICDSKKNDIAKGLTIYDNEEISMIKGKNSKDIEKILGYIKKEEVIHRDNMVIL